MTPSSKPPVSLDVKGSLMKLGELVVKRSVEPRCGGMKLYDNGLGDLIGFAIDQCDLPERLTTEDVAQGMGLRTNGPKRKAKQK